MSSAEHDHRHRFVAMPLGGIGTGNLAIGSDGGLRQWQLHNIGNHHGDLPGSFFAIRASQWEPPLDVLRVLQVRRGPAVPPTPLVDDDAVPEWQEELARLHGVAGADFAATYPRAQVAFQDAQLPVEVRLTAQTPLVPLDVADSALPVAMFEFALTNPGAYPVHGVLGGALHNAVGYDGVTPFDGLRSPTAFAGYGGNVNRVVRDADVASSSDGESWTHLLMESPGLAIENAGAGQMVLSCDSGAAVAQSFTQPEQFLAFLRGRAMFGHSERLRHQRHANDHQVSWPAAGAGPSPAGFTWIGGLAAPFEVAPGCTTRLRFLIAWHFPHRYVNFIQFGPPEPAHGPTHFWLGNHYTSTHADALAVARDVASRWSVLDSLTRRWIGLLKDSSLSATAVEHLAAQAAIIRSPSCFRSADGAFYGFEGVLGRSTAMWSGDVGGSCPLNCTHVWNYAQGAAHLFPELEASMRATELDVMQVPDRHPDAGAVPHRVIVPTYLHQLWDGPIGGPDAPALDGMLGVILKVYRELRTGAVDLTWLREHWAKVVLLIEHIRHWDPNDTGVLHGVQPSTHDIDLRGVNSYMGTLWLAALRAAEEMARLLGDLDHGDQWRALFEAGSHAYDELLFTGEYFRQILEPGEEARFQWLDGCLADQLIGQWWAHELDLGYLLPRDHVRSALRAVVRHNLRHGFRELDHPFRTFADGDDTGLLMCTWPTGGRPEVPTRYCDEVWTGSEYQVAAHCVREGLMTEAAAVIDGVWRRYDGTRRNPYNEIECGDHYVRALAGWSLVGSWSGQAWDAVTGPLRLDVPPPGGAWPVITARAWGRLMRQQGELALEVQFGELTIARLQVRDPTNGTLLDVPPPGATEGGVLLRAGERWVLQVARENGAGASW